MPGDERRGVAGSGPFAQRHATSPGTYLADDRRGPVWLVRTVAVLVLIGVSAFVARQASAFVRTLGGEQTAQQWTMAAVLMAASLLAGYLLGRASLRRPRSP